MKAIRRIGIALLPSLLLIVYWKVSRPIPEPEYKGKPVSYWMMQTRSLRLEDNEGLSAIGTNAIPYLVKALRSRETWLTKLLEKANPKLPSGLRKHLPSVRTKYETYETRLKAIQSLRAFGFEAAPGLRALYEAFQDENPAIQSHALYATYLIGPTKEAVPYLVAAWKNTNRLDKANRGDVISNLEKAGPLDPAAVLPVLIQVLSDPDPQIRRKASVLLGSLGLPAPAAVPKLIALLDDKAARAGAAYALGRVTNPVEAAIPPLRRLVQDPEPEVRASAALTLWRFTHDSGEAIQVLSRVVNTSKPDRGFIAKCLGEMGTDAKEAVPLLRRIAFSDENYDMAAYHRLCAAEAILRIDPTASEATVVLVEALHDSSPWVRRHAAMALGNLGAVTKTAVPALENALQDKDREVRHHARVALQQIRNPKNHGASAR